MAGATNRLGLFLFVVVFILFEVVLVFFLLLDFVVFFLFVLFVVEVVGNGIYVDGMRLRDFQFGFTFGAAQDFALLYFVLIHVNFGATIGAANHGTILRTILVQGLQTNPETLIRGAGPGRIAAAADRRIIYRSARNQLPRADGRPDYYRGETSRERGSMNSWREYPEKPIVGVGGVVIEEGRALLIRRGSEPLLGQWSIPGGTLELGETLVEGTERELKEETGLVVRVLDLIEVFERINFGRGADETWTTLEEKRRPRFHFVIADYLCQRISGEAVAGGDVTDVAWASEAELDKFGLTPTATRVIRKAFSLARNQK